MQQSVVAADWAPGGRVHERSERVAVLPCWLLVVTGAPFPDLTNLNEDEDVRRIAECLGITRAEARNALARLRDPRHRDTIRRRTGS